MTEHVWMVGLIEAGLHVRQGVLQLVTAAVKQLPAGPLVRHQPLQGLARYTHTCDGWKTVI